MPLLTFLSKAVAIPVRIIEDTLPILLTALKSKVNDFASRQSSMQMRFEDNEFRRNEIDSCSTRRTSAKPELITNHSAAFYFTAKGCASSQMRTWIHEFVTGVYNSFGVEECQRPLAVSRQVDRVHRNGGRCLFTNSHLRLSRFKMQVKLLYHTWYESRNCGP